MSKCTVSWWAGDSTLKLLLSDILLGSQCCNSAAMRHVNWLFERDAAKHFKFPCKSTLGYIRQVDTTCDRVTAAIWFPINIPVHSNAMCTAWHSWHAVRSRHKLATYPRHNAISIHNCKRQALQETGQSLYGKRAAAAQYLLLQLFSIIFFYVQHLAQLQENRVLCWHLGILQMKPVQTIHLHTKNLLSK